MVYMGEDADVADVARVLLQPNNLLRGNKRHSGLMCSAWHSFSDSHIKSGHVAFLKSLSIVN